MPTMRDAIKRFTDMPFGPDRKPGMRPAVGQPDFPDALAEYIAAELPPTVDEAAEPDATLAEVVEAMTKHNEQQKLPFATLTVFAHGGGSVRDGNGILFHWPNSDNPGKTAIEVIQAHTKPEPTAKEKALKACKRINQLVPTSHWMGEVTEAIETIREVLEAK